MRHGRVVAVRDHGHRPPDLGRVQSGGGDALGGYETAGDGLGIQVVGNLAYVADNYDGLQILDVSNPAAVTRLGGYDTPSNAFDVQVVGNLAYVADFTAGLQILDVSNPAAVTRAGRLRYGGLCLERAGGG